MAAPSTPGSFVGEHQNGYFWNGTSWDEGGTVGGSTAGGTTAEELFRRQATASAPTPGTAFGGTIINQQNATPTPAPAASSAAAKRASILATIMRVESGGRNIPQNIDDINMRRGDPAQGYFQIIGDTWREHGGGATGHKSALDAPYATQLQIAQNIPVERWGPATQQALKGAGYEPKPGETLGQMLARYNEDPTATRPEDVGGSSAGGTGTAVAAAPAEPNTGLLAQLNQMIADRATQTATQTAEQKAAAEKAEQEKAKDTLFADLGKMGTGLLGKAETPPAQLTPMDPGVHLPDPGEIPVPNYTQAATQPDFMTMLAQQRLQRRT